jgi:hypothetical protein
MGLFSSSVAERKLMKHFAVRRCIVTGYERRRISFAA